MYIYEYVHSVCQFNAIIRWSLLKINAMNILMQLIMSDHSQHN